MSPVGFQSSALKLTLVATMLDVLLLPPPDSSKYRQRGITVFGTPALAIHFPAPEIAVCDNCV